MKSFRYSIVTPDGAIASGECEFLLVPTAEGDIGILANHASHARSLVLLAPGLAVVAVRCTQLLKRRQHLQQKRQSSLYTL